MIDWFVTVRFIHIVSSTVLFGTGIGIAFFMLFGQRSKDMTVKLWSSRFTVMADTIFTLPAVIIQPLSGVALIIIVGHNPMDLWLFLSYILYILIGACWLPVVWLQIRMRNLIYEAKSNNTALSDKYHKYFKIWFILGWPAFFGLIVIFLLMIIKPV